MRTIASDSSRKFSSFRDPSGCVFTRDGVLYRQINPSYFPQYHALMDSGLYQELRKFDAIVAHEETETEADAITIRPERVPFISYPYEWSFGELRDAAMLPLVLDLTNPSPGIGFANRERTEIRARQTPDCVMALAVIHHLAISNNLPLSMLAQWFASLSENLIIEFVPKEDSQVQVLLATRTDIFPNYTQQGFEEAFEQYFTLREKTPIQGSERMLYLWKRRTGAE